MLKNGQNMFTKAKLQGQNRLVVASDWLRTQVNNKGLQVISWKEGTVILLMMLTIT